MNPSVNPSSDSPQLTTQQTEPLNPSISEVTIDSPTEADQVMSADTPRQQPIPPPSEPMQYRAIGLIRGKYQPSEEQLTRGNLLAADGTAIDAVLLGRVMSLVKNHLDLEQSHLWVVYPRTRQEDGNLHVQIVGVWEPERLTDKVEVPDDDSPEPESETTTANDGYFSIRGEVVFHSQEQEQAIIKIKQAPRRESEKEKFFKLTLKGVLAERSLGRFWDLQVQLQGNTLQIKEAKEIGVLPLKKRPPGSRPAPGGRRDGRRPPINQRPPFRSDQARAGGGVSRPPTPKPAIRKEPIPKPIIKRQEKNQ